MKPLRVLIDARMLIGRFSGVSRMVTQLVEALVQLPGTRVVAMCGNEPYEPWKNRDDINVVVTDFSRRDRSPARRMFWEAVRLPGWIRRAGADVYHATWNTGVPFRCSVPAVLTVHDVIPWHEVSPGLSGRISRFRYRQSLRASLRRACRVVTVSGLTADQLSRVAGVDPEMIRVIYNGVESPGFAHEASQSSSTAPQYLLYVGGHEKRKNVETVFATMADYWRRIDPSMRLHMTGTAEQLSAPARAEFERIGRDARIVFLGTPDDCALAREYTGACALLMLSRAEGFGLPVIEAMAHGCPVIAARCGSLPEIVGSAGILVDLPENTRSPSAPSAVAEAIANLVRDPEQRAELSLRGRKRAEWFSWRRAAEAYALEYQLAASTSRVKCIAPAAIPAMPTPTA